jgi:hypothetical protein
LESADKATRLAADVTDCLMNFLLLSFFMVPRCVVDSRVQCILVIATRSLIGYSARRELV